MDQQITIEVIESKEFRIAAKGYDQHEVDEFLDSICDELERMEGVVAELQGQLEMAKAETRKAEASSGYVRPAAPAETPPEGTFREILEMAQRVKEQTIADAEAKAAQIVADAQTEITARLGSLEEERDALTKQVEGLKASAKEYKAKFAELLRTHQEALEQAAEL